MTSEDRVSEWQPIKTAPEFDRVLVCGWQGPQGNVRGYWWWHEDVVCDGVASEHPNARYWAPVIKPDFPEPPE